MLEGYDLSTPKKLHNAKASQNALVNKYLKKLAAQAGIDKPLSTHIARHSLPTQPGRPGGASTTSRRRSNTPVSR